MKIIRLTASWVDGYQFDEDNWMEVDEVYESYYIEDPENPTSNGQEIAKKYGINVFPVALKISNGKVIDKLDGIKTIEEILEFINR